MAILQYFSFLLTCFNNPQDRREDSKIEDPKLENGEFLSCCAERVIDFGRGVARAVYLLVSQSVT